METVSIGSIPASDSIQDWQIAPLTPYRKRRKQTHYCRQAAGILLAYARQLAATLSGNIQPSIAADGGCCNAEDTAKIGHITLLTHRKSKIQYAENDSICREDTL